MTSKINRVLLEWKSGDIHGLKWIMARGLGRRHVYHYAEKGVFQKLGPGVFRKANDEIPWPAVIKYLQVEECWPLHISGRSALELHGHGHYVPMGKIKIFLLSYDKAILPKWIANLSFDYEFIFKKSSLLDKEGFLVEKNIEGFPVKIASRELAALELIEAFDLTHGLEDVGNYLESLGSLRASYVQNLLENCNSVKIKRVFLYLVEKLELPFFQKLKLSKISLGSGKRVIVQNGEFNKKYQITVDRDYGDNPF